MTHPRAVLQLEGDLEQGFHASLGIFRGRELLAEAEGALPVALDLARGLQQWCLSYQGLAQLSRISVQSIKIQVTPNNPRIDCIQSSVLLKTLLQRWLSAESFQPIAQKLHNFLADTELRHGTLVIRSRDRRLHQLPWHLWSVLDTHPTLEVAFRTGAQSLIKETPAARRSATVRILAILGDSQGIDTTVDRQILAEIPQATVQFLLEPSRQQISDSLWDGDWDILFFAGHSRTETQQNQAQQNQAQQNRAQQGRIFLNAQESLTLEELRYGLQRSVRRGLQLGIFNSCDGLGLAEVLESLALPHLIVMREPVPDQVAQAFLKSLLTALARGETLDRAVRTARERLEGLESQFPCATWLPAWFTHPEAQPLDWRALLGREETVPVRGWRFWRRGLLEVAGMAVGTTAGLLLAMGPGRGLQGLEWAGYDSMLRSRPGELPDQRLLIVGVSDNDIAYQQKQGWQRRYSLSDEALSRLLTKLQQAQVRVIGLDVVRDAPVDKTVPQLVKQLQAANLYGVCMVKVPGDEAPGILPPPEIKVDSQGFANVPIDGDGVVRRQLLFMDIFAHSPCATPAALSTRLAVDYLAKQGIPLSFTPQKAMRLGSVIFTPLAPGRGSPDRSPQGGGQVLLNYRVVEQSPQRAIEQVSLQDLLEGKVQPEVLADRIVLVGITAATANDQFRTPYSRATTTYQPLSGVVLQGQMVSQILSAVLDGRALIRPCPIWVTSLGMGMGGILGGALVLATRQKQWVIGGGIGSGLGWVGLCYWGLLQGYWIAPLPALVAGGITLGLTHYWTTRRTY